MSEYLDKLSHLTVEQLRARRYAILDILGMTYSEFVSREMHDGLKEEELEFAKEIDAVDYLLGSND